MFENISWKPKFKAIGVHLGLSLFVFVIVVLLLLFVYYPSFYFSLCGGEHGLLLMFAVDVVLGPLLTFLVYNPNKSVREIILDLTIIGLVQVSAFVYGAYTVYQGHPKLVVLYDGGTATALEHHVVIEHSRFKDFAKGDYGELEGVPIVLFQRRNGKDVISAPLVFPKILAKADNIARNSLRGQDKLDFEKIEKQYKKVWLIAVMGKYNGAFIVLDEKFQYLTKFGDKPT